MYLVTKIQILTINWTMMTTKNKKSTEPGLSNRVRLQLPITVESNMKCKLCSARRAGCQIPRMKKPLCWAPNLKDKTRGMH